RVRPDPSGIEPVAISRFRGRRCSACKPAFRPVRFKPKRVAFAKISSGSSPHLLVATGSPRQLGWQAAITTQSRTGLYRKGIFALPGIPGGRNRPKLAGAFPEKVAPTFSVRKRDHLIFLRQRVLRGPKTDRH